MIASICGSHGLDPVILDTIDERWLDPTSDYPYYKGKVTDALVVDRIFRDHPDIFAFFDCSGLAGGPSSGDRPVTRPPGQPAGLAGGIQFIGYVVRNGSAQLLSGPIYQIATECAVGGRPRAGLPAPRPRRQRTCPEVTRGDVAGGSSRCTGGESGAATPDHAQQHRTARRFTPSTG
ncbi:hypothetical protein GCM10009665_33530 [Kitasatospora nipponensis]|uniref:Uncharacterized protein n=2 Tax=Kitasatospora nipponensis TaxID=258049 RepID=A0ABN1W8I0_9ACTN